MGEQFPADVMVAKVRRMEARLAQVEDRLDMQGPPRKASWIPELTGEQKKTLGLVFSIVLVFTLQGIYAGRGKGGLS